MKLQSSRCCVQPQSPSPVSTVGGSQSAAPDLQSALAVLAPSVSQLQAAVDALAGAVSIGIAPVSTSPAAALTAVSAPRTVSQTETVTAPAAEVTAPVTGPAAAVTAPAADVTAAIAPTSGGGAALAAELDAYLAQNGSPLAGHGKDFVAAGEQHGIDPRLGVAIAYIESSLGKALFKPHNAWGFGSYSWNSFSEGIHEVYRQLKQNYVDGGLGKGKLISVQAIGDVYCPVGAANDVNGTNHHWVPTVTKVLSELGGNPADVRWNS